MIRKKLKVNILVGNVTHVTPSKRLHITHHSNDHDLWISVLSWSN
jgi:oxalate decarboxylase/phosphoglucose isomerase-like protein (cupin superfamily)